MAKGGNVAGFVILSILALGGLGLSGYMFIDNEFLGGSLPYHEHESHKLVAVWDGLNGVGTEFNVSFSDIQLNNSDYFTMDSNNETITLDVRGWYKVTIITTWISLDVTNKYYFRYHRNGEIEGFPGYLEYPEEATVSLSISYYIYSVGNDTTYFHCHSSLADSFGLAANQGYNQAILEYCDI